MFDYLSSPKFLAPKLIMISIACYNSRARRCGLENLFLPTISAGLVRIVPHELIGGQSSTFVPSASALGFVPVIAVVATATIASTLLPTVVAIITLIIGGAALVHSLTGNVRETVAAVIILWLSPFRMNFFSLPLSLPALFLSVIIHVHIGHGPRGTLHSIARSRGRVWVAIVSRRCFFEPKVQKPSVSLPYVSNWLQWTNVRGKPPFGCCTWRLSLQPRLSERKSALQ